MDNAENVKLHNEKVRNALLAAILAVLVLMLAAGGIVAGTVLHYGRQIGGIVDRLEAVSLQLKELDVEKMVSTANTVTDAIEAANIDEIVESLNEVSSQLKEVNWKELADELGDVVTQAQTSLQDAQTALGQINEMDIAALNQAIRDLQDVIEPLGNVARIFGKN